MNVGKDSETDIDDWLDKELEEWEEWNSNQSTSTLQNSSQIVVEAQKLGAVSVDTGSDCRYDYTNPYACNDLDGDGTIEGDFVFDNQFEDITYELEGQAGEFQSIVGEVAFFTQVLSTLFDIASINDLWVAGNYFDSGLYSGKSLLGLMFQSVRLVMFDVEGTPYYA